jgi:hypothetical protein
MFLHGSEQQKTTSKDCCFAIRFSYFSMALNNRTKKDFTIDCYYAPAQKLLVRIVV